MQKNILRSFFLLLFATVCGPLFADTSSCSDEAISVHCGRAPNAAWSGNRLWVVFEYQQRLYLTHSNDSGASFASSQPVTTVAEAIETNGENRPKLIVHGQNIFLSWTQKTSDRYTGDIRFTRSVDGGLTFETPRTVNTDGLLTSHRFDNLLLTADGSLYLTWLDKRDGEQMRAGGGDYPGSAVYYSVSKDNGQTFSANTKIADNSCECCRIAVAPAINSESEMALLWRHIFPGSTRDHAIATVGGNGVSVVATRATVDEWEIDACPHHGPDLVRALDHSGYHLTWFSNGARHRGIYSGYFNSQRQTTERIQAIDTRPGAAHPQIVETTDALVVVWKFFDGEKTQLLEKTSRDQGRNWSEARMIATSEGDTDHPLLLQQADTVYVSWLTSEGYRFISLGEKAELKMEPATKPFVRESLAAIKAEFHGQPFLLSVWSLSCLPCRRDFALLQQWQRQDLITQPLVFVSTDEIALADEISALLASYPDLEAQSWAFAGAPAALRYALDPQWYGELPRTYFFNADHRAQAHSGVLTSSWLEALGQSFAD